MPFFVCVAIWLGSGASGSFWPAWVALIALIPLARNGWRLYGPAPELERVEDELRRGSERLRRQRPKRVEGAEARVPSTKRKRF